MAFLYEDMDVMYAHYYNPVVITTHTHGFQV